MLLACATVSEAVAGSAPPEKVVLQPEAERLLALNLYHEAGGEGRMGMLAVGWVVLNRLADPRFPKTVAGVVGQGCQFGWLCDDRSDEPTHRGYWHLAQSIAHQLLTEPPADPTRGAMWFHHGTKENPGWGGRMAPSARIGNHLFYAPTSRLPKPRAKPWRALQVAQR
jgi:spore germination cell wall hydrolase CwlJ-like protein